MLSFNNLLSLALILIPVVGQARVFDINKDSVVPYFLITGGSSLIGTSALVDEGSASKQFTGGVGYNYTGEFGFLYSTSALSLRFGFEIIKPMTLDSTASDGTSELYSAKSELLGYAPKVGVEVHLHKSKKDRSFVSASLGSASLTMKNSYVLSAAGQTAYPGVIDHSTESKSSATEIAGSLGYEGLLSDNTTIVCEFGYRQLKFDSLSYSKDVTTFSGAKKAGDSVLTTAGSARALDFSGGFISIGFRFYY